MAKATSYFGPKNNKYNNVAVLLHWLIGLTIILMFILGWYMHELPKQAPKVSSFDFFDLGIYTVQLAEEVSVRTFYYNLHKSIGVTLLLLIFFRVYWRVTHAVPKAPKKMSIWETRLMTSVHHGLYLLMVLIPVSGIIMSVGSKYGIHWFGIPFLPGIDHTPTRELFKEFHEILGQIMILLLVLHILGVIKHIAVGKENILKRIWFHRR